MKLGIERPLRSAMIFEAVESNHEKVYPSISPLAGVAVPSHETLADDF
jgi:hypothetical protein